MAARRGTQVGVLLGALLLAGCTGSGSGGSVGLGRAAGSQVVSPAADPVDLAELTGGSWSVLEPSPLRADLTQLLWDGVALVELAWQPATGTEPGGWDSRTAAYRPDTLTWQPLQPPAGGLPGGAVATALTPRGLVIVGDRGTDGRCCVAAVLPPGGSGWQPLAAPPLHGPSLLGASVAVPAGTGVLVVHAHDRKNPVLEGAWYDPRADRWTRIDPPTPRDHPPMVLTAVSTPQGVLLWSLWARTENTGSGSTTGYAGVDVFRLGTDGRWADVTGGWPQGDTVAGVVPAGDQLLLPPGDIWCGACSHPSAIGRHGYLVDPATLARTAIPAGPVDDLGPPLVWTGAAVLALNGSGSMSGPAGTVQRGDLAAWAPGKSWVRLPRAPLVPGQAAPVWADGRLLVLAGDGRLMAFTPSRGRE